MPMNSKSVFLLFLLSLTGTSLFAQRHLVGVGFGLASSNVTSSNFLNETDARTGLFSSLSYQYLFSKHFSIGADLSLIQKGFRNRGEIFNGGGVATGEFEAKYNYDYLGLGFKVGYHTLGKIPVFVKIGLAPSLLISAKTSIPSVVGIQIEDQITNVRNLASSLDIVGIAESGLDIPISSQFLLRPTLTYEHGLSSISNESYFAFSEIHNRSFRFTVRLFYDLYKKRKKPQSR